MSNHASTMAQFANDCHYMRQAIRLAKRGIGRTHPNPHVGAVVVQDGHIVGEGWHQRAGEAHAEVHALQAAAEQANNATIYVTLEPCHAHGKTPPCTQAILNAGIQRVVYASADPNPCMRGGGCFLEQQGLHVTAGVLQAEADAINRPFFRWIHDGLPYVIAKAAISLDGKLATYRHHSRWISGEQSRRHAHRQRAQADAILVGAGTFRDDDPTLDVRDVNLQGSPPLRVVVMRQLVPFRQDCRLLQSQGKRAGKIRFYVLSQQEMEQSLVDAWQDVGVTIFRQDDLLAMLRHLANDGYLQLLLEGGGHLHASFFEQRLTQELLLYQAPCLIGGTSAVNLWHGQGIATMPDAPQVEIIQRRRLGHDQLIRGLLCYPEE